MLKDQVPDVKSAQGSRPWRHGTNVLIGGGFIHNVASMETVFRVPNKRVTENILED